VFLDFPWNARAAAPRWKGGAAVATKNPYVGFRKDQRRTYSLWESFNSGELKAEKLADPYVRLMINEWKRCVRLGVDPTRSFGVRCTDAVFEKHLRGSRQLLDTARPFIDKVTGQSFDVPGIVVLANAEGVILYIAGNSQVRDLAAARSGVVEGSCWLETVAGTNGMGSALSKRQPVHVFSTEHFCEGWHRWTCAATPLFDPDSGETIGVIDFTTVGKDYHEQAVALTAAMAQGICGELSHQAGSARHYLLQRYEILCDRYRAESLILLDERGRLLRTERNQGDALPLTPRALSACADPIPIHMEGTGRYLGTAYVLSNNTRSEVTALAHTRPHGTLQGASLRAFIGQDHPTPERQSHGVAATLRAVDARERAAPVTVPPIVANDEHTYENLLQDARDYQVIFDNAIVGICYSIDRKIVRCNRRFEDMLGYEPGELDKARFQQIFPTEREYRRTNAAMAQHFLKHRVFANERLMRRKSGELFWCALSAKKLNPGTRSRRAIWILQDISRRKNAEEALQRTHQRLESLVEERTRKERRTNEALRLEIARRKRIAENLRESQKKYQTLFETSPVGMFVTDRNGAVVEVNKAMARMIPKPELISSMRGSKSAKITQIHPDGTKMKREEFADARALREGKTVPEFEFGVRNRDGQVRWFSVSSAPMPVKAYGAVVAHREITETKRLEEQERAQRMELARASRVNTMGEMAAAMAHELGQPLSCAVNFLSGCQLRIADGQFDQKEISDTISQALHYAEQAGDIIKHIRQFVRLHEPNTVLCDLNAIIKDMGKFMDAERRQHDASIEFALSAEIAPLRLDPFEIRQLMVNLIKNGLEAIEGMPPEQRVLTIATKLKGRKWVEVTVSDRGKGVTTDNVGNIFKPFFSTKQNGMGLGLVICRSIVESHGGKLSVCNNLHGGATFTACLPNGA
jgi:PAS domain S-box-containing protein